MSLESHLSASNGDIAMTNGSVCSRKSANKDLISLVGRPKKHDNHIIHAAKKKCRTDLDLDEWNKQSHATSPDTTFWCKETGFIAREHTNSLSVDEFIAKYEKPNLPVVIEGLTDEWLAARKWTIDSLYERFRHRKFHCGDDDDGHSVRMKLKYFLRYMATQTDDSPLYIFDGKFDDDTKAQTILKEYTVPKYFRDDLFSLLGEDKRPPYRWFLIGPKRSGSCVHIDPLSTSAWNSLISGYKRWVLFPPGISARIAKGKGFKLKGEDDEAVDYFTRMLPRIKKKFPEIPIIEYIQKPGETMFIPGGWYHGVLNLEDTIAVTQNFCSRTNFPQVWLSTRLGLRSSARRWLDALKKTYPDLAQQALEMNIRDSYSLERTEKERQKRARIEQKRAARIARRKEKQNRQQNGEESDSSTSSSSSSCSSSSDSSVNTAKSSANDPYKLKVHPLYTAYIAGKSNDDLSLGTIQLREAQPKRIRY